MDSKALAEVDDILNFMNRSYQDRIPENLKRIIRFNKDPLYDTKIKEFPKNLNNLRRETIIILGIIYEKYILNTEIDISEKTKKELVFKQNDKQMIYQNNSISFKQVQENLIVVNNKENFLRKLKIFLNKIKDFFKN